MLQACLNGARAKADNAAVPASAAELAADAAAVRAAGADELHVHPRGPDGAESLEPGDMAVALDAIRRAAPGMPVGVSTGAWIAPGGTARHVMIRRWTTTLPDYASVNLSEDDTPAVIDILLAKGIGVEAGLADRRDAARFLALPRAGRCLRVLIEVCADPAAALAEFRVVAEMLDRARLGLPVLLHGQGASAWPMVAEAARAGLSTRIGLEDVAVMPDGSPAPSNAALVAAAAALTR